MKKRSKFSLSHDVLLSCNGGQLVPIGLTEVIPGDTIQHATSAFVRLAPLVSPVMHPVHVKIHHWYVPLRLIWDEFEDFITGGEDGLDTSELPYFTTSADTIGVNSLGDYLGIPPGVAGLRLSILPFRAYSLIFNEWYRWPQLQDALPISKDSGEDTVTSKSLQRSDWEKDYFTTATPSPQLGPSVTVPVDINTDGISIVGNGTPSFMTGSVSRSLRVTSSTTSNGPYALFSGSAPSGVVAAAWNDPKLKAEVGADLGSISIDSLREAFALQRFAEHRSLYGSRYVEYLRYLGIRASDARLQRPEYLGGGKQTVQFSEVLQTAEGADPVGTLRGHGIAAMRSNRYRRFIEEHGYILSFLSIVPKAIYSQGIQRTWLRQVKEDFYQKELESIGEQEVLNAELYAPHDEPRGTFGYQARYQEYRGHESYVTGEFRDLLDYWHMARTFSSPPALNNDFLTCVPTNRIFASRNTDQFYIMAHHSMQARRLVTRRQSATF